ncbi:hypothetical protein ACFPRL_34755 [Pseudoclavibacter helvolus]
MREPFSSWSGIFENSALRTRPTSTPASLYSRWSASANLVYDSFATTVSVATPRSATRV